MMAGACHEGCTSNAIKCARFCALARIPLFVAGSGFSSVVTSVLARYERVVFEYEDEHEYRLHMSTEPRTFRAHKHMYEYSLYQMMLLILARKCLLLSLSFCPFSFTSIFLSA